MHSRINQARSIAMHSRFNQARYIALDRDAQPL
jgi:hypothetical protein